MRVAHDAEADPQHGSRSGSSLWLCRKPSVGVCQVELMQRKRPALFPGRHFEDQIIVWCVHWYLRYSLSYRDLEEMMVQSLGSYDHALMPLAAVPVVSGCFCAGIKPTSTC